MSTAGEPTSRPDFARAFVENELGPWSSHPHFARAKVRRMLRWPVLAVTLAGGWFVWKGATLDLRWLWDALENRSWWVLAGAFLLVVLVSAIATGMFVARFSASRAQRYAMDRTEPEVPPATWIVLLLGAVVAGALFFYLPRLVPPGLADADRVRRYSLLAALAPYVFTLTLLDLFDRGPSRRRGIWLIAIGVMGMASGSTAISSLRPSWAEQFLRLVPFGDLPWLGPWFAGLSGSALQGALQVSALVLLVPLFWALGEWTLSGIPAPDADTPSRSPSRPTERRGWWRRFWDWLLGRSGSANPAPEGTNLKPEWLGDLPDKIAADGTEIDLTVEPPQHHANPSPPFASPEFDPIFGGLRPSSDQVRAVRLLSESGGERLADSWIGSTEATPSDLLLEGPNGVGKTTVLLAHAILAAVARGGRVGLFVPDTSSRDSLVGQLRSILHLSDLQDFVAVGSASLDFLNASLELDSDLPEILVATPDDWESAFFGAAVRQTGRRDRTRAWLLSFTTLMIDDLASAAWSAGDATHLPALVDKQRLLLAMEGRTLQLVATTTPVGSEAFRRVIWDRFVGPGTPRIVHLRPWLRDLPWRIVGRTDSPVTALPIVVGYCLDRGLQVVVFLDETGAGRRAEFEGELTTWLAGHPGNVAGRAESSLYVVNHLVANGEIPPPGGRGRVVLYAASGPNDSPLYSLASRLDHPCVVHWELQRQHIHPGGLPARPPSEPVVRLPVFVAREAPVLLGVHLRSATVFLRAGTPLPREALGRFGIEPPGFLPRADSGGTGAWNEEPMLRFALDPPEPDPRSPREEIPHLWSMACFAPAPKDALCVPRPADIQGLVEDGWTYRGEGHGCLLSFGRRTSMARGQQLATWRDTRNALLRTVDLVHLRDLRIRAGQEWYWCRELRRDESGRYVLIGDWWRNNGQETYRPIYELSAELEVSAGEIDGSELTGMPAGMSWIRLARSPANPSSGALNRGSPATDSPAFRAHLLIHGAANEAGTPHPYSVPLEVEYPAVLSVLVLGSEVLTAPTGERPARLRQALGHRWSTTGDSGGCPFWPELTRAFLVACDRIAPRLGQFARVLAFRMADPNAAAILWIEPQSTAGTVERSLWEAFQDPKLLRDHFLPQALAALQDSRASRIPFPDHPDLDPATAVSILQRLLVRDP